MVSFWNKTSLKWGCKIIKDTDSEIVFEISFDYIGLNRKNNSLIGDNQKSCVFKFKVNKNSKLITDYIYEQR